MFTQYGPLPPTQAVAPAIPVTAKHQPAGGRARVGRVARHAALATEPSITSDKDRD